VKSKENKLEQYVGGRVEPREGISLEVTSAGVVKSCDVVSAYPAGFAKLQTGSVYGRCSKKEGK
jgi:hypothetical protein